MATAKKKKQKKGEYEVGFKKPPKHGQIKPGEVRNPNGARNSPRVQLARLTHKELLELGQLVLSGSVTDLQEVAKDKNASAAKVMVAALVARVIQKGDTTAFNALLDRFMGPVKQKMELTGENGAPLNPPAKVHLYLPKNGRTKEENEGGK